MVFNMLLQILNVTCNDVYFGAITHLDKLLHTTKLTIPPVFPSNLSVVVPISVVGGCDSGNGLDSIVVSARYSWYRKNDMCGPIFQQICVHLWIGSWVIPSCQIQRGGGWATLFHVHKDVTHSFNLKEWLLVFRKIHFCPNTFYMIWKKLEVSKILPRANFCTNYAL